MRPVGSNAADRHLARDEPGVAAGATALSDIRGLTPPGTGAASQGLAREVQELNQLVRSFRVGDAGFAWITTAEALAVPAFGREWMASRLTELEAEMTLDYGTFADYFTSFMRAFP